MRTPRRYLEPLEHEMTDQQLDDVEIPDDEGALEEGPRDVPDAAAGDDDAIDLSAGDAVDADMDDDEGDQP